MCSGNFQGLSSPCMQPTTSHSTGPGCPVPACTPPKQMPAKLCPQDQLTCGDRKPFLLNSLEFFLRVTYGSFQQARGTLEVLFLLFLPPRQLLHQHMLLHSKGGALQKLGTQSTQARQS